jgi:hypothetical protein
MLAIFFTHKFSPGQLCRGRGAEISCLSNYSLKQLNKSQVAVSATTALYDCLEILCALAPNTGLRLCVHNRRSITPLPHFVIGVEPKISLSI